MDLFDQARERLQRAGAPLADRMRPRTLDEFIGQDHIVGPGRLLRRAIAADQLSSLIFYGPPGTGKTTLARIIANTTRAHFIAINAVLAGVKDIRDAIASAQQTLGMYQRRTILFVDEVHRFNKTQQDALLPHVENGVLILIGATTENPYFEVNKALVSRSRIFQLKSLDDADLKKAALAALADAERGYGDKKVRLEDDALEHLSSVAHGDARSVLNALELAVETTVPDADGVIVITRAIAEESIQQKAVLYDRDGDAHYDTISAFIKSVRGSDPDAALYWMARMVYAGEDPRFIFRRMIVLASEDIGLADPQALGVVMAAAAAFDYVGLPEGRFHLSQACLYLASAPKSNTTMAFFDAIGSVTKERADDMPNHLRDKSRDAEGFGHGEGYLYPHAFRDHWVAQQYLPTQLQGKMFYQPSDQGFEATIKSRVEGLREARVEAMMDTESTDPLLPDQSSAAAADWSKRVSGTSGENLAKLRDTLLDMTHVNRASLVLDVNCKTGLLALAASRRATEGGVWALCHDETTFATVSKMAGNLDVLKRPQVLKTDWEHFDIDLVTAAGKGVQFDSICGRNVVLAHPDKAKQIIACAQFLRPGGTLAFAESVPSDGQRLSDILTFSAEQAPLAQALHKAEAALYGDKENPLVNWHSAKLHKRIAKGCPVSDIQILPRTTLGFRRITAAEVERWFLIKNADTDSTRKTLGDYLGEVCSPEHMLELKKRLLAQLTFEPVPWKSCIWYIIVTAPATRQK